MATKEKVLEEIGDSIKALMEHLQNDLSKGEGPDNAHLPKIVDWTEKLAQAYRAVENGKRAVESGKGE